MITEIKPSFILITDIINGVYVKEKYIGYSLTESKKRFKKKYYTKIKST